MTTTPLEKLLSLGWVQFIVAGKPTHLFTKGSCELEFYPEDKCFNAICSEYYETTSETEYYACDIDFELAEIIIEYLKKYII